MAHRQRFNLPVHEHCMRQLMRDENELPITVQPKRKKARKYRLPVIDEGEPLYASFYEARPRRGLLFQRSESVRPRELRKLIERYPAESDSEGEQKNPESQEVLYKDITAKECAVVEPQEEVNSKGKKRRRSKRKDAKRLISPLSGFARDLKAFDYMHRIHSVSSFGIMKPLFKRG